MTSADMMPITAMTISISTMVKAERRGLERGVVILGDGREPPAFRRISVRGGLEDHAGSAGFSRASGRSAFGLVFGMTRVNELLAGGIPLEVIEGPLLIRAGKAGNAKEGVLEGALLCDRAASDDT